MGISLSLSTDKTFLDKIEEGAKDVVKGVDLIFSNTNKLYTLSLLIQSIFDGINFIRKPVQPLSELSKTLINFTDLVDAIKIIFDIREMVVKDKEGKWVWDKAWYEIAEHFMWTGAHALQVVTFLEKMRVFDIAKVAMSALNTVISGLKIGACVASIGSHSVKIHKSREKEKKIDRKLFTWEVIENGNWVNRQADCDAKLKVLENQKNALKAGESSEKIDLKIKKWTFLKDGDQKDLKALAKAKAEKWKVKEDAEKINQKKSWINIAFNISYIALLVFLIALEFSPLAALAPVAVGALLIAVPIVVSVLDFTCMMIDEYWKAKPVPKINLDNYIT